jgi:uncharacterized protein YecT (DUF1311 family)
MVGNNMSTYIAGILTGLLPAAGIGVWYLVRRYNEKHPLNEALDRAKKTADLKKTLEEHNYSLEDLKEFQEGLMDRSEIAKKISDSFASEAKRISELLMSNAMTQTEMNHSASESLQITEIKLNHVTRDLVKYFDPKEIKAFEVVQEQWRRFQKLNAEFLRSQYEGGSIAPLIHASAMESVAITRLIELESDLQFKREIIVPYLER